MVWQLFSWSHHSSPSSCEEYAPGILEDESDTRTRTRLACLQEVVLSTPLLCHLPSLPCGQYSSLRRPYLRSTRLHLITLPPGNPDHRRIVGHRLSRMPNTFHPVLCNRLLHRIYLVGPPWGHPRYSPTISEAFLRPSPLFPLRSLIPMMIKQAVRRNTP